MAYTPTTWENGVTPINAGNLNKMEQGIKAAHEDVREVSVGGTGKDTHTLNSVLTGNGTDPVNNVATANGAFYATAENGEPKFGVLPIGQGGTGKTKAADALAALGGTNTKLLWENASPTSNFGEQTISLDLSEYEYIDITVRATTDKASQYTTRLKVGGGSVDIGAMGSTSLYRPTTPTTTGVKFLTGRGYSSYNSSSTVQGDAFAIPLKIYGIKGVQ